MENIFASDVELNNQYYAYLIRGQQVGKIERIELPQLEDECFFITKSDIKGKNAISLFGKEMPIFATERIEYSGQVVGVLVASSEDVAMELSQKIHVVVQEEAKDEFEFTKENIETIEERFKDRIISKRGKKTEKIDECFKDESSVVSSFLHFSPRSHYMAEPLCVKVRAKQNSIDVYVPTQWASHVKKSVAEAVGESEEKVKVIPTCEAYSLNGRIWFPSLLATQISVAAWVLKKNICFLSSFKESFLYSPRSPHIAIRHKSQVDVESGKIEAMSILCVVDAGAYNLLIEEMLTHIFLTSFSVYSSPIYEVKVIAIKLSGHLTDLFVNWGDYYTNTAIEKHISDIVDCFNLDFKQFRLDNMIKANEEGFLGVCKRCDYKMDALMEKAISATTFGRKYAAYRAFNRTSSSISESYCRGIGLAVGLQYNGLKSVIKEGAIYTVQLELTKEMQLIVKAEPSSDELKDIFIRKISKGLNIEPSNIIFESIKNIEAEYIGPSIASCTICVLPILLDRCFDEIQKQRFREPLPIVVTKDYKITGRSGWDSEKMEGQPFISETAGACVVELKLEKSTYNVKVQNIYMIVDGGEVFSKGYITSAINRGIATSLSGVLKEEMPKEYSRACDYTIISANEMPNFQIKMLESRSNQVKGISSLPFNLVAPAFISALNQILQTEHLNNIPIMQQDIFDIMEEKNAVEDEVPIEEEAKIE